MPRSLAVLDTDVILFLVSSPQPDEEAEVTTRRDRVKHSVDELVQRGADFVIPTPVIAELHQGARGSDHVKKLSGMLTTTRTETLSVNAADIAGEMIAATLPVRNKKDPNDRRVVMKFDALICAIAHDIGAKWLVTANERDMGRYLRAVKSPVEIVDATGIPTKGQLNIVHINPAKKK